MQVYGVLIIGEIIGWIATIVGTEETEPMEWNRQGKVSISSTQNQGCHAGWIDMCYLYIHFFYSYVV